MDEVVFAACAVTTLGVLLTMSAFGKFEQPKQIRAGKKPMNDWMMDVQLGRS